MTASGDSEALGFAVVDSVGAEDGARVDVWDQGEDVVCGDGEEWVVEGGRRHDGGICGGIVCGAESWG